MFVRALHSSCTTMEHVFARTLERPALETVPKEECPKPPRRGEEALVSRNP